MRTDELYDQLSTMKDHSVLLLDQSELNLFRIGQADLPFQERLNLVRLHLADLYRVELLDSDHEALVSAYQSAVLKAVIGVFEQYSDRITNTFSLCNRTAIAAADAIPMPLQAIAGKLLDIRTLLQTVRQIAGEPEAVGMIHFYELLMKRMLREVDVNPGVPVMECALKYLRLHRERHRSGNARKIVWGEEYDTYLEKYRKLAYREKTAKTYARRDFIAAHPLPQTSDEILDSSDAQPGHTMAALRRYHQAYLESCDML